MISPTIPQCQLAYGKITAKPLTVPARTFKIPLLSTIVGLLIPADQFVLIPLKTLNNFLL